MSTEKKNKVWKRSGIFDTYEEAIERKESLISDSKLSDENLLIKIKRYGKGYNKFQVKYWHPNFVVSKKKKKQNK